MYVGCACGCGCEGRRAVTQAERHSQAKDNAVCVCVCVYTCAHRVGGVWPVCGLWGQGVCGYACGVWAETEAERHSQAKDNAVCVCMCGWCVGPCV